ncbi:hypothetical protein GCM10007291_44060 [Gemmobacter nanjingensis]|uniref:Uncharacterized protein n=1 Tax=Gemmobacter nanjingensis TaxID=488454 RepID=A0ABQ3FST3_9RHOB|nr:hypothetical protein GCM10007291_44060 [Gemmobacter nanjingensis]
MRRMLGNLQNDIGRMIVHLLQATPSGNGEHRLAMMFMIGGVVTGGAVDIDIRMGVSMRKGCIR